MVRGKGWDIRYDLTARPSKWSCKEICKRPDFPIKFMMTISKLRKTAAAKYSLKHREAGLAKCKNCNYITAQAVKRGTRCSCCGSLLSHSIYHKIQDKM